MSLSTILEHAGWSNESTFVRHYEKVIQDEQDENIDIARPYSLLTLAKLFVLGFSIVRQLSDTDQFGELAPLGIFLCSDNL